MQGLASHFLRGSPSCAVARHTVRRGSQKSRLHTLQKITKYRVEDGLGDFLPPQALKTVAIEYQQGLLDRLNDEVRGTELENKTIAQTVIETAGDPNRVLTYNYASEALNNSFFLNSFMSYGSRKHAQDADEPLSSNENDISPDLRGSIETNFMSLEQLKSNFGGMALGMFNGGWLWLVCDAIGTLAVLPTFGTETLLIRSRKLMAGSPEGGFAAPAPRPAPAASQYAASSRSIGSGQSSDVNGLWETTKDKRPIGDVIYPLMCLSLREHVWMSAGYGVWGKEEYVMRMWSAVDWKAVSGAYTALKTGRTK